MSSSLIHSQPNCADETEEYGRLRVDDAVEAMLAAVEPMSGSELVSLFEGLDRVLAEPVIAPFDVPPCANSAVDGYAIRAADIPDAGTTRVLPVSGVVLAGQRTCALKPGTAMRIMTGAPLPDGADTVLMQERVEIRDGAIRIDARHRAGDNVRPAGEDVRTGETVLEPGRRLTPPDLGLIASLGRGEVRVKRRLKVALLSTGDELCGVGEVRRPGCIYDSNRHGLGAALRRLGAQVIDLGIVPDRPEDLRTALLAAAAQSDVVISSGGVSVGDADYVRSVLTEIGDIAFWKVAIKPGRPIAFGHLGSTTFFGLPGNPVAVFVTFYSLVLPVLERLAGQLEPGVVLSIAARCQVPLRKKPGRTEFQRGVLFRDERGEWCVRTTGRQGSGILRSMSLANAFIVLPHDSGPVEPGDSVIVLPFAVLF